MNSEPLVFPPDMMCDARLFAPRVDGLSHERSVMVAPVHLGERVEEIASMILDLMPHRFVLCGHAFGGSVTLEILRRAPNRVNRRGLIAASPMAETPIRAAEREP